MVKCYLDFNNNMGTLHNAIRRAVNQFGFKVLTEIRIINVLSDFAAFSTLPATKTILKYMVENGHCQKICDLGRKKNYFLITSCYGLDVLSLTDMQGLSLTVVQERYLIGMKCARQ